jgi:hypothetical protein
VSPLRPSCCLTVLALIAAALGCDQGREQPTEPPAKPAERFTESDKVKLMEAHYTAAIQAHDALIAGDLAGVRQHLTTLSQQALPANAPAEYGGLHAQLMAAAKAGAAASELEAAGAGMARVTEACGTCHAALGKGPVYRTPAPEPSNDPSRARMLHQRWVSERLWEGVTGPWDDAWKRGAAALGTLEVLTEATRTEARASKESALRALGAEAQAAAVGGARADLYGRVLARCGDCHAQDRKAP